MHGPTEWVVCTVPRFDREMRRLDRTAQARIVAYLAGVTELPDPRLRGKRLVGGDLAGLWRYRVGEYRVIVQIVDARMTIIGLHVGNRSSVYDT